MGPCTCLLLPAPPPLGFAAAGRVPGPYGQLVSLSGCLSGHIFYSHHPQGALSAGGGSWGDRRGPSGGSQALHWVLYIFTPQQGVGNVSCQLVHQDQGPTLPHTGQMHTGACHALPLTAQQALRSATLSCRSSCCARRWPGLRSPQWT